MMPSERENDPTAWFCSYVAVFLQSFGVDVAQMAPKKNQLRYFTRTADIEVLGIGFDLLEFDPEQYHISSTNYVPMGAAEGLYTTYGKIPSRNVYIVLPRMKHFGLAHSKANANAAADPNKIKIDCYPDANIPEHVDTIEGCKKLDNAIIDEFFAFKERKRAQSGRTGGWVEPREAVFDKFKKFCKYPKVKGTKEADYTAFPHFSFGVSVVMGKPDPVTKEARYVCMSDGNVKINLSIYDCDEETRELTCVYDPEVDDPDLTEEYVFGLIEPSEYDIMPIISNNSIWSINEGQGVKFTMNMVVRFKKSVTNLRNAMKLLIAPKASAETASAAATSIAARGNDDMKLDALLESANAPMVRASVASEESKSTDVPTNHKRGREEETDASEESEPAKMARIEEPAVDSVVPAAPKAPVVSKGIVAKPIAKPQPKK